MNKSSGSSVPMPFSLAFSYIFRAVAANWMPMPVLFLNKVISLSSARPRHLPFSKIAQLMQIFGFDDAALDAVVKLRLLVEKDLRLVADDDEVRLA